MDDQNKNIILASVLSALVLLAWMVFFPAPEAPLTVPDQTGAVAGDVAATGGTAEQTAAAAAEATTAIAQPRAPRLTIETPALEGTISMLGGRLDDLRLRTYRDTIEPGSDIVQLLSPVGEDSPYYALHGWSPAGDLTFDDVPGANSEWQLTKGATLRPGEPVTLSWQNTKGLTFARDIAVDDKFMFTITDRVTNTGTAEQRLAPYGLIARHGLPKDLQNIFVVHEGVVGRADGTLTETDYSDVADLPVLEREGSPAEAVEATTDGWIGFTDHYWMTTLIPEQGKPFTSVTKYVASSDVYQTEIRQPVMAVAPGQTVTTTSRLFAGAKEWETIRAYQNESQIGGFVDSIDWGWFFYFTKPIFAVLHWLNGVIGNMGLAIIGLTFFLKLLVLPLAYKSYVSMARMKELQPEMEALKERVGDDKPRMQREMMQLYKDKKVNPAAGCLPILIQIPIFFSLYKVIFVTIELRHAPFFGWLRDLSAPDTSSLYNLFGLLPWDAPASGSILHLVFLGILPLILGVSMWLQQKLNPAPADPVQASIFAWMPWVFMFMMGGFASGLLVYWITNNMITFTQQYLIMKSHGHTPDLFGNIRKTFARKDAVAEGTGKTAARVTSSTATTKAKAAAKPAAKPAVPKAAVPKPAVPANRPKAPTGSGATPGTGPSRGKRK